MYQAYDATQAGMAASPFPPGACRPRQVVWAKVRHPVLASPYEAIKQRESCHTQKDFQQLGWRNMR